jgi:hypothetical protein
MDARISSAWRLALVLVAAVALSVVLVFGQVFGGIDFDYQVEAGVSPKLEPDAVRSIVVERLDAMARQTNQDLGGATALAIATSLGRAPSVYPDVPDLNEAGWSADSVVWVVKAHAPFMTLRGRSTEPLTADSGFLVIDDATGEIVAMGFPLVE